MKSIQQLDMVQKIRRYIPAILTVILFCVLFALSVWYLLHESRIINNEIIAHDVVRLQKIFKKIDDDCHIMSFDHQKNYIDFLNVEKFVSSEIGSMNLMLPDQWKGPYLKDNLEVQGVVYQMVRTKKGYFITPGDGVKLSNGKVVGKDIVLDENADIQAMARDSQQLHYNGKPLALPITLSGIKSSAMQPILQEDAF